MSVEKYRKKPVEIEAVQWDGTAWELRHGDRRELRHRHPRLVGQPTPPSPHDIACRCDIAIDTLEGRMTASPGDWVIRGVQGEFYPIKSDIFEATYERVADDERTDSVSEVRGDEAP